MWTSAVAQSGDTISAQLPHNREPWETSELRSLGSGDGDFASQCRTLAGRNVRHFPGNRTICTVDPAVQSVRAEVECEPDKAKRGLCWTATLLSATTASLGAAGPLEWLKIGRAHV